jgi:hypothetical protein
MINLRLTSFDNKFFVDGNEVDEEYFEKVCIKSIDMVESLGFERFYIEVQINDRMKDEPF